ncbi:AAA family ATPase [Candidatus Woesearchaeota archaeon]|nr:AAA family ATPase [Candidatus Woesearchaeota archaeon]
MNEKRVKTGVIGLDKLLNGGLLPGRSILLSGPCGSGKSILAVQFLYNGATKFKEKGLYINLEEEKHRIFGNMQTLGLNLERLEKKNDLMIIGGQIAGIDDYMYKVGADVNHIIEEIEELVKQNKVKRVVIDSINLLTMLCKDNIEKRKVLTRLTHRLNNLDCTSILISEVKENTTNLSRFGIEEFVVDGVIGLYLLRNGDRFIPGIVVRKMRGSDHDKSIRLYKITKRGIEVYPNETLFTEI